jgi:hypothetical protein
MLIAFLLAFTLYLSPPTNIEAYSTEDDLELEIIDGKDGEVDGLKSNDDYKSSKEK